MTTSLGALRQTWRPGADPTQLRGVQRLAPWRAGLAVPAVLGPDIAGAVKTAAGWSPYGSNLVEDDDGWVKITYVDDANGAYCLLTGDKGLKRDMIVGDTYRTLFEARINTGAANAYVNAQSVPISNTVAAAFEVDREILASPVPRFRCQSMGSGQIMWFRAIRVRKVY